MVDYVSLIANAVAKLDPNTGERRYELYDRARKALADRLQAGGQAYSAADMRAEMAALEDAIRWVEADARRRTAAPRGRRPQAPPADYRDRPPLTNPRLRLPMIAGVFALLLFAAVGIAAYFYGPHVIPTVREQMKARDVAAPKSETVTTDPSYIFMRQLVYYRTNYPAGTIVVDKSQAFLYLVRPRLAAVRYRFGLGSECARLVGLYDVVRKEEWPGWEKTAQVASAGAQDRAHNPLGARALYLNKGYLIHGTSVSPTVKQDVERCIGLINDDVIDLYDRVALGSRVVVLPN